MLAGIAPEADLAHVGDDEDLREALDLDSMDFLNFVIGLHERTGIDIPRGRRAAPAHAGRRAALPRLKQALRGVKRRATRGPTA